ncbi:hypothetical protein ACFL48_04190 [Pseudomonadota bacterium]
MTKPTKENDIPPMSPEEAQELINRVNERAYKFSGNFDELEKAVGMLFMGRLFGWKVLALMHNKRTIRKYENILDIQIREFFKEEGPLSSHLPSYELVKKLGNYWKAVSGEFKLEDRREIAPE